MQQDEKTTALIPYIFSNWSYEVDCLCIWRFRLLVFLRRVLLDQTKVGGPSSPDAPRKPHKQGTKAVALSPPEGKHALDGSVKS